MSRRTGLMEWPIHQLGGSTFVTSGVTADGAAAMGTAQKNSTASVGVVTERL